MGRINRVTGDKINTKKYSTNKKKRTLRKISQKRILKTKRQSPKWQTDDWLSRASQQQYFALTVPHETHNVFKHLAKEHLRKLIHDACECATHAKRSIVKRTDVEMVQYINNK